MCYTGNKKDSEDSSRAQFQTRAMRLKKSNALQARTDSRTSPEVVRSTYRNRNARGCATCVHNSTLSISVLTVKVQPAHVRVGSLQPSIVRFPLTAGSHTLGRKAKSVPHFCPRLRKQPQRRTKQVGCHDSESTIMRTAILF